MKRQATGSVQQPKMKSIKTKLQKLIIITVVLSLLILGVISCIMSYTATMSTLKNSLEASSKVAAEQVSYQLQKTKDVVETLGTMAQFSSDNTTASIENKSQLIQRYQDYYGWESSGVFGTDGVKITDSSVDISDRDYFVSALSGETCISDPIISKTSGKMLFTVAAPIWQGGIRDTAITGVIVAFLDISELSDLVSDIHLSTNGSAFIVNEAGTVIAHKNYDLVTSETNLIELAQTDSSAQKLSEMVQKMTDGETGVMNYTYSGENKVAAYAPIDGTNGWSIAVNSPVSDFMPSVYESIAVIVVILLLAIIFGTIIATRTAVAVGTPIQKCADRLEKLAQGDFQSEVPVVKTNDETKRLADSTALLVNNLKAVIGDIDYLMTEMSNGVLTARSKVGEEVYLGDLSTILIAMKKMNTKISQAFHEISTASEQVASGAEQLASGAISLSQGATEQAASVEELAATISEISTQTEENARHAANAEQDIKHLGENIQRSDKQMKQLINAMNDINSASSEIGKIIKTIEDIAFQTNILALNAAVEAARAGTAGKGFAVVADEVRNLAGKSGEAANSTTALIDRAIRAVEEGSHLVGETGTSLNEVVLQTETVVETMSKIIRATERQAQSVSQVTAGIDQISSVVQSNSSAAEESAATSEELSSQAELLKQQVNTFQF